MESQNVAPSEPTDAKAVPFAPGYFVDTSGTVYEARGERLVALRANAHKDTRYPRVNLRIGGSVRRVRVHRIMAATFLGPAPSPSHSVRHLNDCKTDNRLENLAWGTAGENLADARLNGKRGRAFPLTIALVHSLRRACLIGGYSVRRAAKIHGVPESTASDAVNVRTWKNVPMFDAAIIASARRAANLVHPRQLPLPLGAPLPNLEADLYRLPLPLNLEAA